MKRISVLDWAGVALGIAGAIAFAASFPEVEGLGGRVRLPVFHGALTWVNLGAFAALGFAALLFVVSNQPRVYRYAEALRWISIPMWLAGSALGLIAALKTWDFTGSKSSHFAVVSADPRLMAQFWVAIAGVMLLALGLIIEERYWRGVADLGFSILAWGLVLRAILGPGRALHPDSPVLNSDEIGIKLLFFGIVGSLALASVCGARLIAAARTDAASGESAQSADSAA